MRSLALLLVPLAVGCTAGAPPAGAGTSGAALTIDVSLTASTVVTTPYGSSAGYVPAVADVALGTTLRFINRDTFAHTATSVTGTRFPDGAPLGSDALTIGGDRLSTGWTSGTLAPGAASQTLLADRAGTYLYGCFFHYGGPMRAAIVVH